MSQEAADGWKVKAIASAKRYDERNVHPVSRGYFELLDTLRELHLSKSADYGSDTDPLLNIRNGAVFVGIPSWKAAMVRLSDKVTRLAAFNRNGRLRHEGVEDSLLDLASYSLLALLLYREDQKNDAASIDE